MDGFEDNLDLGAEGATPGEGQDPNLDNLDFEDQDNGGQDDDPVIEIDGQEVPLSEIKRWRDTRTNLESAYTKKFQDLATQRKQVEPLMNWLRANPQQARVIAAVADGQMTPDQALQLLTRSAAPAVRKPGQTPGQAAPAGQVPPEVMSRLSKMEQLIMTQLQAQADQQITATLAGLAERANAEGLEWTPEFEREILQTAHDNNTSNLEHVYEALAYRRLKDQIAAAKKQGEKETLQNLQQKRKVAGNILGGQQRGGTAPAKPITDYKGATEAAMADEALMNSLFTE